MDGHCEGYYYHDIYDLGQAPYNKEVINLRANQMINFHKAHNHKQKLFLVIYLLCVHKKNKIKIKFPLLIMFSTLSLLYHLF